MTTRYLLLIHEDEARWASRTDEERAAHLGAYRALWEEMEQAGHGRDGDGLRDAGSATLVRVREGEVVRSDGPYSETKEQLGGYFVVECDLDTAVGYASRIPAAGAGTIEVRRIGADEG